MRQAHLLGRRYINLVRVSKDEQADTSPDDQGKILHEFAAENGMIHAGNDMVLEGVTGSVPSVRTDIEGVIQRKRDRDDFDTLLIQDFSRFTRVGIEHGGSLKWELARVGIEVVFVTFGSTGDADQDGLIQSMGFYAAQQHAKAISHSSTRGVMSSRAAGKIPHTPCVPYGVDRLYVGNDGVPRHRIRNLADGRQHMLHPTDEIVLRAFATNPKKGASTHYKLQSDEKIVLVPGAKEHVEVVRRIFRQKLLHGDGTYVISKALNNDGIVSPKGKLWALDSVESVLTNPVYTGVGISGPYRTGIYNIHGDKAAPEAVERQLTTIARHKKGQKSLRRKDLWKWMDHPRMQDYLGELRDLEIEMQEIEFAKQDRTAAAPPPKKKPGGDRHVESPFVLKDILRSAQGNHPMSGRRAGSRKTPVRYYAVTRGLKAPKDGSTLGRMIPAEPLERAVMEVVKDVLRDIPNLRKQITALSAQRDAARNSDQQQLQPLLDEQAELQQQIPDAMTLGASTRRLIKEKIERWEAQSLAMEERIAQAKQSVTTEHVDPIAAVNAVSRRSAKRCALDIRGRSGCWRGWHGDPTNT